MFEASFHQFLQIHYLQQIWSVEQLLEGIQKAMNITDEQCFFWKYRHLERLSRPDDTLIANHLGN